MKVDPTRTLRDECALNAPDPSPSMLSSMEKTAHEHARRSRDGRPDGAHASILYAGLLSKWRYRYADAMLAAREPKPAEPRQVSMGVEQAEGEQKGDGRGGRYIVTGPHPERWRWRIVHVPTHATVALVDFGDNALRMAEPLNAAEGAGEENKTTARILTAIRGLLNEVDCRMEHGVNPAHLEYVRDRLHNIVAFFAAEQGEAER